MVAITRNGAGQSFQAQRKELQSGASPIGRGRGIRALLRTTAGTLGAICVPATMGIAVGFSQPAWAQAEASSPATTDIVVTGSRIKRPNLDSTVPIASVGAEDIVNAGQISVGDQLNQLPQLRSTFSQANSTRFIGTAGQNFLDLRGMGTNRTLVLLDGRRFVSSSPGDFEWDVNNVPADLIERVDVVTGGNSAIYGSDAVAGAVNFILKRKFEGFQIRGKSGISGEGDSNSYSISGIAGKNFAEGRGNITLATEYAKQDSLYLIQRKEGRDRRQFQLVENLGPQLNPANGALRPDPEAATGNGVPDTAFIGGLRRINTSEGGMISSACPTAAAEGESNAAFTARRALTCSSHPNPGSSNALARFGNPFGFMPDGTLRQNRCVTDFRPFGSGNCLGGFGATYRESGQFRPELKRLNATLMARFELSDAFQPFVEAQYVRVNAIQQSESTFGNQAYAIDNPYLSAQARTLLPNILSPGATSFTMNRINLDFGARGERHERNTYRVVGGIEGKFNDDWNYEISANYGRFTSYYETEGNYRTARFERSIDAQRNAAGQIVCGVNADADASNDDPTCVPVNLFGAGNVSKTALDYFGHKSSRRQKNEQFIVTAFVSGDSSQLFELPGGPIGFAIGGEYRAEKQRSAYDEVTASGQTFLNLSPPFAPPTYKVKDLFGEIRIPILRDTPFFDGGAGTYDPNTGVFTANPIVNAGAMGVAGDEKIIKEIGAAAKGARSIAIGTGSDAAGDSAIAQGDGAKAGKMNAVAVGTSAQALGDAGVAMGLNAQSGATGHNVAIGQGATSNSATAGGGAVSIGRGNKADGDGAVAIGDPNAAIGNGALALGRDSVASSDGTATGTRVDGPVALGNTAIAAGQGSVSIGNQTEARAAGAIAIGDQAAAGRKGATGSSNDMAFGTKAEATGGNSAAIGSGAKASAANSVALGSGSATTAVLGDPGYNPGDAAVAGVASAANGEASVGAAGKERRVTNVAAGAAPTDAVNVSQLQSQNKKVDQLGANAAAALGGGSTFDPKTGALTVPNYNVAGKSVPGVEGAVKALDDRADKALESVRAAVGGGAKVEDGALVLPPIKLDSLGPVDSAGNPVSPPTTLLGAVDALDGEILKNDEALRFVDEMAVKYDLKQGGLDKGNIRLAGGQDAAGNPTGTTIHNLAPGTVAAGSMEAVNGGQLHATNQAVADGLGGGAKVNPDGSVAAPTYAIHNPGSTTATTPHKNVGDALGALDAGVVGNTGAIDKLGKDVANGAVGPIQQGATPGQLALVAPGATGAAPGAPQGLTNVAPGRVAAGSTDAVNGGQLNDVAQTANKGFQLSAQGANASQVKPGDTVDISGADANIGVTKGAVDSKVKLALSRNLNVDSVTIPGGPNGPVTLGAKGLDNGGNVLTGVGEGKVAADSTDAVIGAQLATLQDRLDNLPKGASGAESVLAAVGDGAKVEDGVLVLPKMELKSLTPDKPDKAVEQPTSLLGAIDALDNEVKKNVEATGIAFDTAVKYDRKPDLGLDTGRVTLEGGKDADGNPTGTVNGAQLHATNERVAAHGTQLALLETGQAGAFRMNNRSGLPAPDARGDDAVAGGFGAVASGARSTAIGSNAVASGAGSVALGHGATDGGRDNVVSVGREGAERQVTNVAAGTRPTDAVNLGQLSNAIDHGLVAATGYTDHHVNALRFDLANVRRDADAGTASAMAVAGLPQAFGDSGGMIGGAIGVYQNETAFALGVSKVFGDGRTVVKGGATYVETSRGSTFGGNVGIGYQF